MASSRTELPVLLFGYDSSPFTNKVRLVLRIKKIPYSYIRVPSMLPRPILTKTFALTYRKIPVLSIGTDLYCDTSLIIEALEHFFPTSSSWGTIYPDIPGWSYHNLARGFASFWTDRPLFRATTGLIPGRVWRSPFGGDRAQLIGHAIDAEKLAAKSIANLSVFDMHLSLFEGMLGKTMWVFPTRDPSLADVAVYYQIRWGIDIAGGKGVYDLTGGSADEACEPGAESVFNQERYPRLWGWFHRFKDYISSLPEREVRIQAGDMSWKVGLKDLEAGKALGLVPTAVDRLESLDNSRGLTTGVVVSVAPDDTGRENLTVGRLVGIGVEEAIMKPWERGEVDVNIHFPRMGFTIKKKDFSRL